MAQSHPLDRLHNSPRYQKARASLEKTALDFGRKDAQEEAKRIAAMARTLSAMLPEMPEEARTVLFAQLELAAKKADRRLIASHPDRPAAVDQILEETAGGREAAPEPAPQMELEEPQDVFAD